MGRLCLEGLDLDQVGFKELTVGILY